MHLTQAGEEVYRYARSILGEVDEMGGVLDRLRGFSGGQLRIAAISSANYFAPRLLGTFHERFPDVDVSMNVTNQTAVLELLFDTEADDRNAHGQPVQHHAGRPGQARAGFLDAQPLQGTPDQGSRAPADHEPDAGEIDSRSALEFERLYERLANIDGRINSMASSILPPRTTIVLRLETKEFLIIASRQGKSISNLVGSRKRITTKLSSAEGKPYSL